jgi:tripartite ATP-independent transporter DctP family solute receptor
VSAEKQIKLRYGHPMPPTHVENTTGLWIKKQLAERTKGIVNLEVYPSEMLGSALEMGEACMAGTLDMTDPFGAYSRFWQPFGVVDFPFIIKDWKQYESVFFGPLGKELADGLLQNTGIRILGWWPNGFRNLLSTKPVPILEVKDIKGLKVRLDQNPLAMQTFKAIGASPVAMGYGEVYTSLTSGVIDAMEGTILSMNAGKFAEVAKYLAHTKHRFLTTSIGISEKRFKSLPPNIQKILLEVCKESQYIYLNAAKNGESEASEQVRKFIKWETYPDLRPFVEAVKPTFEKTAREIKVEDWLNKVEKLAQ